MCLLSDSNIGLSGNLVEEEGWDYYEIKSLSVKCDDKFQCSSGKCINMSLVSLTQFSISLVCLWKFTSVYVVTPQASILRIYLQYCESYVRQPEYVLRDCKLTEKWSLLCLLLAGTQTDWSVIPLKIVVLTVLVVPSDRFHSSYKECFSTYRLAA